MLDVVDDRLVSGNEAAQRSKGLAEGGHDQVHVLRSRRNAPPCRARRPSRPGRVHRPPSGARRTSCTAPRSPAEVPGRRPCCTGRRPPRACPCLPQCLPALVPGRPCRCAGSAASRPRARRAPSTRLAWSSLSSRITSPRMTSALITPRLVCMPVEKTSAASLPTHSASSCSSRSCSSSVPLRKREPVQDVPKRSTASIAAWCTRGSVVSPR